MMKKSHAVRQIPKPAKRSRAVVCGMHYLPGLQQKVSCCLARRGNMGKENTQLFAVVWDSTALELATLHSIGLFPLLSDSARLLAFLLQGARRCRTTRSPILCCINKKSHALSLLTQKSLLPFVIGTMGPIPFGIGTKCPAPLGTYCASWQASLLTGPGELCGVRKVLYYLA